jgi:hypothetical protein
MHRALAVGLTVFAIALLAHAGDPDTIALVKKLAKEMGDATLRGDSASLIDRTYPGVVHALGGRQAAIDFTENAMKKLKAQGFVMKSVEVGEPGPLLVEGSHTFVVVPTAMEMSFPRGKLFGKSYFLGVSSDGGKTWTFADGAAVSGGRFRDKVLPKLPANLKLPDKMPPRIINDK